MGANQPRAMNMHGGVCIDVDVNEAIIDKRIKIGFTDIKAKNLDEAIEMGKKFSSEKSSGFINGVLDAVLKKTIG